MHIQTHAYIILSHQELFYKSHIDRINQHQNQCSRVFHISYPIICSPAVLSHQLNFGL